jgi:AcrR family transcriptional regulator
MARTRSLQYPEIQQRILNRAAELFAARGFRGASIAELARACESSKAWIYHYYDSKEAILYALLRAHMEELLGVAARALAASDDPEAQFRAFVRESLVLYAAKPEKHVVLMNDLDHLPPEQAEEIKAVERELVATVAGMLGRIDPTLSAVPQLRKPFAMMFYGLINWTYIWYDAEGPVAPPQLAKLAADLFLDGFRSRPRP